MIEYAILYYVIGAHAPSLSRPSRPSRAMQQYMYTGGGEQVLGRHNGNHKTSNNNDNSNTNKNNDTYM